MSGWDNFKMPDGGTEADMRKRIDEVRVKVSDEMHALSKMEQGVLRRALSQTVKYIWPDGDA
jgi:hypothetical protein